MFNDEKEQSLRDYPLQEECQIEPDVQTEKDPWIHRSKGMLCLTCVFYVKKKKRTSTIEALRKEIGRCRRHAPTMSGYPVVFTTDWCGDHKLDENKI